jgi:hypothetical protein
VVLAALFLLGVFNPQQYTNEVCNFQAGFSCTNFYMDQNGLFIMNIIPETSTPINVTAVGCNQNTTSVTTTNIVPQIYLPIDTNVTLSVQCDIGTQPFSGTVGQVFTGYLELNYTDTSTGFPSLIHGYTDVKVGR